MTQDERLMAHWIDKKEPSENVNLLNVKTGACEQS